MTFLNYWLYKNNQWQTFIDTKQTTNVEPWHKMDNQQKTLIQNLHLLIKTDTNKQQMKTSTSIDDQYKLFTLEQSMASLDTKWTTILNSWHMKNLDTMLIIWGTK